MARTEKQRAYRRGVWAERYACLYLMLKGYRFLANRVKTPVGEIDLVFRKSGMVVAVEVKNRPDQSQATLSALFSSSALVVRCIDVQSRQNLQALGIQFDAIHPSRPDHPSSGCMAAIELPDVLDSFGHNGAT